MQAVTAEIQTFQYVKGYTLNEGPLLDLKENAFMCSYAINIFQREKKKLKNVIFTFHDSG